MNERVTWHANPPSSPPPPNPSSGGVLSAHYSEPLKLRLILNFKPSSPSSPAKCSTGEKNRSLTLTKCHTRLYSIKRAASGVKELFILSNSGGVKLNLGRAQK